MSQRTISDIEEEMRIEARRADCSDQRLLALQDERNALLTGPERLAAERGAAETRSLMETIAQVAAIDAEAAVAAEAAETTAHLAARRDREARKASEIAEREAQVAD